MRKIIVIETCGANSKTYICALCESDLIKIEKEITAYLKEYIGNYDTSLDNVLNGVVENAMNGRLCDLEEQFEFTYRRNNDV